jgi:hypothetical protein
MVPVFTFIALEINGNAGRYISVANGVSPIRQPNNIFKVRGLFFDVDISIKTP